MKCPLCHDHIAFAEGIPSLLLSRIRCAKCETTFRITAPGQTAILSVIVVVFMAAAIGLGVIFFTDFWSGIIGIACLVLLLLLVEFLIYHYYSRHGQLQKVEP